MSQTQNFDFFKSDDQANGLQFDVGSKTEDLVGVWYNTVKSDTHIDQIIIKQAGPHLTYTSLGGHKMNNIAWRETKCSTFSSRRGSAIIEGFRTTCDLEDRQIQVAGNVKYGILVVQMLHAFKKGEGKNNYFTREFFHKQKLNK